MKTIFGWLCVATAAIFLTQNILALLGIYVATSTAYRFKRFLIKSAVTLGALIFFGTIAIWLSGKSFLVVYDHPWILWIVNVFVFTWIFQSRAPKLSAAVSPGPDHPTGTPAMT